MNLIDRNSSESEFSEFSIGTLMTGTLERVSIYNRYLNDRNSRFESARQL